MLSSRTSQSLSPSPDFPSVCVLTASSFSSLPPGCHPERSEGSTFLCRAEQKRSPVSPFPATLTNHLQLIENTATLSPFAATLTSRVKHNPFVCHSYKKHPGWVSAIVNLFVAQTSVCALLRQSASQRSAAKDPQELKNLAVLPVASHQSQITKPCRIRTCEKRADNSFGIRTSKTQDCKL
jgi:hypothetical protein